MSIAPSIRPSSTWSRGSKPRAKSRGVPTVSSTTKSSSPPAGRLVGGEVGDRHQRRLPGLLGGGLGGLGRLDLGGERLGAGQQLLLLLALRLRDLLAELLLLGPLGLEVGDRPAPRRVGRERRGRRRRRTARAWPGRHARGRGRRGGCGGRSLAQGYRRAPARHSPGFRAARERRHTERRRPGVRPEGQPRARPPRVVAARAGPRSASCCSAAARPRRRPGLGPGWPTFDDRGDPASELGGRRRRGCARPLRVVEVVFDDHRR